MKESDSWQNAKKFSVLGMPIILDEPLVRTNNEIPTDKKKVILALDEKIELENNAIAVKKIESVNVRANIIKIDRFENWIRVDGELEFAIEYTPRETGLLDEELNIDKFLNRLNLDNEEVEEVNVDWERFFANEDLDDDDDDDILDEFEDDDFEDLEDENDEAIYRNNDNAEDKLNITREKNFSVIIDLGETNIKDQDIIGLSRVEFNKARLLGSREIKLDIVLGIEINTNKREMEESENWYETPLLTQGDYSLAKSGLKIDEIVAYHLEPEIRNIKINNGQISFNGFLNIQIAFYHRDEERNISTLNLRKPITINNLIDYKEYDLNTYKLLINNSNLSIKNQDTLVYEAEASFWLKEIDINDNPGHEIYLKDDDNSFDDLLEEYESKNNIQNEIMNVNIDDNYEFEEDELEHIEFADNLNNQEIEGTLENEDGFEELIPDLNDLDIEFIEDMGNEEKVLEEVNLQEYNNEIEANITDDTEDYIEDITNDINPIAEDYTEGMTDEIKTISEDIDMLKLDNEFINSGTESDLAEIDQSFEGMNDADNLAEEGLIIEDIQNIDENLNEFDTNEADLNAGFIKFDDEIDSTNKKDILNIKYNNNELKKISAYNSKIKSNVKKIIKDKVDTLPNVKAQEYTVSLYLIKEGDTLDSIAEKYSLVPEEILQYNKITSKDIYPNNSIFIRKNS